MDALRPLWDAERPGLHSHAERGNDQSNLSDAAVTCRQQARHIP